MFAKQKRVLFLELICCHLLNNDPSPPCVLHIPAHLLPPGPAHVLNEYGINSQRASSLSNGDRCGQKIPTVLGAKEERIRRDGGVR